MKMSLKLKRGILLTFLLSMFFVACFLFTGCGEMEIYLPAQDDGYTITNYSVDIIVHEDRSLTIEEKIDVYFEQGKQNGIYRYIPLEQTIGYYNQNGKLTQKNYVHKISNFEYLSEYSTAGTTLLESHEQYGYMFYAMGDWGNTEDNCSYAFRYDYELGDDRLSGMDVLYLNIIGTGWDTDIENVDFSITYFADIESITQSDDQIFEFYIGRYGEMNGDNAITSSNERMSLFVEGNRVWGNVNGLSYGEAVTIYQTFENGFFDVPRSFVFDYVLIGLLVFAIIMFVIFFLKNKKRHLVVDVVEFAPPPGITPAQAGYIIDGQVHGQDISALLVYWASKGYVQIEEKENKLFVKKVRDLPQDAIEHEKIFFASVFKDEKAVDVSELGKMDVRIGNRVSKSIKRKKATYFETRPRRNFFFMVMFAMALYFVQIIRMGIESHNFLISFLKVLLLIVVGLAFLVLPRIEINKFKYKKWKYILYKIINIAFVLAGLITICIIGEGYCDPFGTRFIFAVFVLMPYFIYPFLEQYTKEGASVLGRMRGLKRYIEVAEKDRLEMLVKDDPSVFYNVLPFAYVLGVSDVYMNKFKDIPLPPPQWLTTSGEIAFWTVMFGINRGILVSGAMIARFMTANIIKSLAKIAAITTVSRVGGGGGFSGGGAGGGGGGRF